MSTVETEKGMLYAGTMGSPCSVTSECRALDLHSYCDSADRVCVCDEGRRPSDDRRHCALSLPPTDIASDVAIFAACIVVICILVIVIAFLLVWMCKAFVCLKPGQHPPADVQELPVSYTHLTLPTILRV